MVCVAYVSGRTYGRAIWSACGCQKKTHRKGLGVNPQTYFTDLLTRLVNGWPQRRIDELMPWHWTSKTVH